MKTACKRMITQQVSEILRIEIEDGDLYPGTKIPTDTELAEMFGVQKQTVRTAIEVLVKEGLLKYISDKEVYVLGHKIERNMEKLEGFTQTMVDRNMKPSFRIVSKYLRMAGNLYGNMFGIKPEEPIFYIKRMCYADGDSISLEELYIPINQSPPFWELNMTMAAHLVRNPDIPHARIAIAFTPDEEIGRGTENFDIARFGAAYACTFDGGELGELESENFNAASATLTVTGVGVHPGAAKNKMVNAARIAANFAARLPVDLAPETTEGREGFLHPHEISGSVTDARVIILIRDHDKTLFEAKKTFLRDLAAEFAAENPRAGIRLEITDSYENMRPYVERTPAVMALVREAFADAGVTPVELPIRGGTDGAMLSVRGLPCPNIFTGGLNYHGVYECLPVRSLEKAAEVAVALARRSATLESLL